MRKKQTKKFIFIAGPCVIEDKRSAFDIAARLGDIMKRYPFDFIFKASFYKANRTSLGSFRGPGIKDGLKILAGIKKKYGVRILSDIHCRNDIAFAQDVLDVIQIPAFLSRQTDLIVAAAATGKPINIKKAQFMSPEDMAYVIEKVVSTGNKKIILTERGSCFGYNNLVVDFRSFLIMKKFGYPVIYDVTHSLQRPSAQKGVTGGDREFVRALSLAGVACGIDGIFMEVHPFPSRALSDRATSFPLSQLEELAQKIIRLREVVHEKE